MKRIIILLILLSLIILLSCQNIEMNKNKSIYESKENPIQVEKSLILISEENDIIKVNVNEKQV